MMSPVQPRNVLLTVGRLDGFTGSEMVTRELAEHFASRGSYVAIVTNVIGPGVQEQLRQYGNVTLHLRHSTDLNEVLAKVTFDLVWVQHSVIPDIVFELAPDVPVVFNHMSRSVAIEKPLLPELEAALATVITFNSEQVRETLVLDGLEGKIEPARLQLFANPAPDAFSAVARKSGDAQPRLLVVSNHIPAELMEALQSLENDFSIRLVGRELEKGATPQRVDPSLMATADVVITIGKTVQYAIAADVAVYCYDEFGGPGWLTKQNFREARFGNFSGAPFGKKSAHDIVEELRSGWSQGLKRARQLKGEFGPDLILSSRLDELISWAQSHPREGRERLPESTRRVHAGIEQIARKWFRAMSSAERSQAALQVGHADAIEFRAARDADVEEIRKLRAARDADVEEIRKLRAARDAGVEEIRKLRAARDAGVEEIRKLRAARDAGVEEIRKLRAARDAGVEEIRKLRAARDADVEEIRKLRAARDAGVEEIRKLRAARDAGVEEIRKLRAITAPST